MKSSSTPWFLKYQLKFLVWYGVYFHPQCSHPGAHKYCQLRKVDTKQVRKGQNVVHSAPPSLTQCYFFLILSLPEAILFRYSLISNPDTLILSHLVMNNVVGIFIHYENIYQTTIWFRLWVDVGPALQKLLIREKNIMGKQINNTIQNVPVPPLAKGLLQPQLELSWIKLITDHLHN